MAVCSSADDERFDAHRRLGECVSQCATSRYAANARSVSGWDSHGDRVCVWLCQSRAVDGSVECVLVPLLSTTADHGPLTTER